MKSSPTNFEEVFAQLKEWGSDNVREIYTRHGAGDNLFGVTLGNLRGLAKKLKTNHDLALQLLATGNMDACMLATMIMDPERLSAKEVERMVKPITYYKLMDELVENVLANTSFADDLRARWMDSPEELPGRAGWKLLATRIVNGEIDGLDFNVLLKKIEAEMLSAPKRKQEAMNYCLVEIGIHFPEWRQKCISLGERLGRFDKTPVPKGCTSSYAPEWIAAILKLKK